MLPLLSRLLNFFRLWGLPSHRRRVRSARRMIAKLSAFPSDGQVIAYLRKADPLAFEELLLCLFEANGFLAPRNRSYSGDGGVDGRAWRPSTGWIAIQCKRHSRAIDPASARKFALDVSSQGFRLGVFAHTGRTGEGMREALGGSGLLILSGSDLASAIRGAPLLPMLLERKRRSGSRQGS